MSRREILADLKIGESAVFEGGIAMMQQIGVDARRAGVRIERQLLLGVHAPSRRIYEVVRVTRI